MFPPGCTSRHPASPGRGHKGPSGLLPPAAHQRLPRRPGFWPARPHWLGAPGDVPGAGPQRALPANHAPPAPPISLAVGVQQLAERSRSPGEDLLPGTQDGCGGVSPSETPEPPVWDLGLFCTAVPIQPPGAGSASSRAPKTCPGR